MLFCLKICQLDSAGWGGWVGIRKEGREIWDGFFFGGWTVNLFDEMEWLVWMLGILVWLTSDIG